MQVSLHISYLTPQKLFIQNRGNSSNRMSETTSLHGINYAKCFREGFVLKNSEVMRGGNFLYVDTPVRKLNSGENVAATDGDIDAGFVLLRNMSLNDLCAGVAAFSDDPVIPANTFVHFELTAKSGEDIFVVNKNNVLSYVEKKIEFHKRLVSGKNAFTLPAGVTSKSTFLVVLFNGVDRAKVDVLFKQWMNDRAGVCAYVSYDRMSQWRVQIQLEREAEAREAAEKDKGAAKKALEAKDVELEKIKEAAKKADEESKREIAALKAQLEALRG